MIQIITIIQFFNIFKLANFTHSFSFFSFIFLFLYLFFLVKFLLFLKYFMIILKHFVFELFILIIYHLNFLILIYCLFFLFLYIFSFFLSLVEITLIHFLFCVVPILFLWGQCLQRQRYIFFWLEVFYFILVFIFLLLFFFCRYNLLIPLFFPSMKSFLILHFPQTFYLMY